MNKWEVMSYFKFIFLVMSKAETPFPFSFVNCLFDPHPFSNHVFLIYVSFINNFIFI